MPAGAAGASGDTVAIVTADAQGNAVSLIQSLYHEFGSAVVAGDTGVLLQNRRAEAALVTRIVDRGLGPQEAVKAPRRLYGRTWGEPSTSLRLEGRFEAGVAESLARRGHDVRVVDPWSDAMGMPR